MAAEGDTRLPRPLLLDVSRSLSRAGLGPATGIDRVERAYLTEALSAPGAWFLARRAGGLALIDAGQMRALLRCLDGQAPWDRPRLTERLALRRSPVQRGVDATLARLGANPLPRRLPPGTTYLNVGHSNISVATFDALRRAGAATTAVMLHDTIPLDHPDLTRKGTEARFTAMLRAAGTGADLILCNSRHTEARARHWLAHLGLSPRLALAPLGWSPLPPPGPPPAAAPYCVTLGTIEPRKNHALLLDIWDSTANAPALHVVGRRGWAGPALLRRLDHPPPGRPPVIEHAGLDDAGLSSLLAGAEALLFPSLAEGFGYPLVEALSLGVPVIASGLPAFREIAGTRPLYLDPHDRDAWRQAILGASGMPRPAPLPPRPWSAHFADVTTALDNIIK